MLSCCLKDVEIVLILTSYHGILKTRVKKKIFFQSFVPNLGVIRFWSSQQSLDAEENCPETQVMVSNMTYYTCTNLRVMAAAHWSLRMSKQIAPVTLETLGCQILVMNLTLGGLKG